MTGGLRCSHISNYDEDVSWDQRTEAHEGWKAPFQLRVAKGPSGEEEVIHLEGRLKKGKVRDEVTCPLLVPLQ